MRLILNSLIILIVILLSGCEDEKQKAYNRGYHYGYELGKSEGFTEGRERGLSEGSQTGFNNGYQQGLREGRIAGHRDGKEEGYALGRNEGYGDGIEQAEALSLINAEKAISNIVTGQCPCIEASLYSSVDDNIMIGFLSYTSIPVFIMIILFSISYASVLLYAVANTKNSIFGFMFGFTASVLATSLFDVKLIDQLVPFMLGLELGIYYAALAMIIIGYVFSIVFGFFAHNSSQVIVIIMTFFIIPFSREIFILLDGSMGGVNQNFTILYAVSSSAFLMGLLIPEVMHGYGTLTWALKYVRNRADF